ncbi:MAG: 4-(cytidine 5'-diphospho)-2-C-methyl-D-erythritol kinase [Candidatus Brocadiia bacterium]
MTPETIHLQAPAKLNIFLDVKGKREDGYHEIETVMVQVSLCDEVVISVHDAENDTTSVTSTGIPLGFPQEENLCWRAVEDVRKRTGLRRDVSIHVEKRIPLGAGLGGGSSDAAAVLKGLALSVIARVSRPVIQHVAESLGSDVPFFLQSAPAICTGRGEIVHPVRDALDHIPWVVIAVPPLHLSTASVYGAWSANRMPSRYRDAREFLSEFARASTAPLHNGLSLAAQFISPELRRYVEMLPGSSWTMTGSGCAFFCLTQSEQDGQSLIARIPSTANTAAYLASPFTTTADLFAERSPMNISEVKIKLVEGHHDKLLAFASVTFENEFVVRDLKVIQGNNGYFVAMPSRKLTDHCPRCHTKNHLRSNYCSECGLKLPERKIPMDERGRARLHADIAHPINTAARERLQKMVVEAYERESARSKEAGYRPTHDYTDAGPE